MGNKGDAEKMKVLITEERYRHEAKFAEPESNPSNHNFAIAVSARLVCVWPASKPFGKVPKFISSFNFVGILRLFRLFLRSFTNHKNFGTLVLYTINSIKL